MQKKILISLFIFFALIGFTGCSNKKTLEELENVNKKINEYFSQEKYDYDNFVFKYIDKDKMKVVVGLKENNEEQQNRFKNLVIDSNYLEFVEGADYNYIEGVVTKVISEEEVLITSDNTEYYINKEKSPALEVGKKIKVKYNVIKYSSPARISAIEIEILD